MSDYIPQTMIEQELLRLRAELAAERERAKLHEKQVEELVCRLTDDHMTAARQRDKLREALEGEDRLIRKAQSILTNFLIPDSGIDGGRAIDELLALLDGPEQREAQGRARAVLNETKGDGA